ncbi:MFS transporter [Subtercola sp. YIM 133946]|uniref:MFS transporter n=1 Tax=Subtercola sp. YIM 133946 TaxID=3118909 RepID=UPI002F951967
MASRGSKLRSHLVDISPLRESPAFARLFVGEAISAIGAQMTIVAVGLQIYNATRSTFDVALLAAFALVPMVVFGLYGGVLADTFDRRRVALVSAIVAWAATVVIAVLAWVDLSLIWPLYILVTVNAVATTVVGATRQAIAPRILPTRLLPAAAALVGISMGLAITVGPAIAGLLVAGIGIPWAYTIDAVLFVFAFVGIASLPRIMPDGGPGRAGLRALVDGVTFLRKAPNIRVSFGVDIVAMIFGQPRALLPAVGAVLIGGGAVTVGLLIAAGAVGALLSGLFSGSLTGRRWQGRIVGHAIVVYGWCIFAFGVVLLAQQLIVGEANGTVVLPVQLPALILAIVFLAGAGAADNIGGIFRGTILQAAAPDDMRGRLQGIFTVVVTAGPRLGDLYVGVLTLGAVLWLPPLVGGIAIVVLITVMIRVTSFRRYDALNPTP